MVTSFFGRHTPCVDQAMPTPSKLLTTLMTIALAACSGRTDATSGDGAPASANASVKPGGGGGAQDTAGLVLRVSNATTSTFLLTLSKEGAVAEFAKPKHQFVTLTVERENASSQSPVSMKASGFTLEDVEGVVRASSPQSRLIEGGCDESPLSTAGEPIHACRVAFETPASATPFRIHYTDPVSNGRYTSNVGAVERGPLGFCDQVSHWRGEVSRACSSCINDQCRAVVESFGSPQLAEPKLPVNECTEASYCICEYEDFAKRGQSALYASLEGCIDTKCVDECVARD